MKTDVYAKEMKDAILAKLDELIAEALIGPRVTRRRGGIELFHHEFAHADLSERTTSTNIHGKTEVGPDKYPFIEFTINTTRYKVRSEHNYLTFMRKRISKLTLDCFEVNF